MVNLYSELELENFERYFYYNNYGRCTSDFRLDIVYGKTESFHSLRFSENDKKIFDKYKDKYVKIYTYKKPFKH